MLINSEKLQEVVDLFSGTDDADWAGDCFDMTSTGGYDNDGSSGPELIDNGVVLGMACRAYHQDAKVFMACGEDDGGSTCYYQFGMNENDAVARVTAELKAHAQANDLSWPPERETNSSDDLV